MASLRLLLEALQFPRREGFDSSDEKSFRELVNWLENTKIRALPLQDRRELGDLRSIRWFGAFYAYLEHLSCPIERKPAHHLEILEWLLRQAVHLEYTDVVGVEEIRTILPKLGVECKGFSSSQVMVAARKTLEEMIIPVCQQMRHSSLGQKQEDPLKQILEGLPLGFELEDPKVALAAKLLRLLYLADLRELQSQVDQAIVNVQEYTANPKTDTSLGRVGR